MALHNFEAGPNAVLSFLAEYYDITSTNALVFVSPLGTHAGIVHLRLSVILLVQANSTYLELYDFYENGLNTSNSVSIPLNSTNFDFDANAPIVVHYLQWMIINGITPNSSGPVLNYGVKTSIATFAPSANLTREIEITVIRANNDIRVDTFKVNVLIVGKTAGFSGVAFYSIGTAAGDDISKSFTYNMGVPYYPFKQPKTGERCIIGLQEMNLKFQQSPATMGSSFEFTFYGNELGNVIEYMVSSAKTATSCFSQCATGTYYANNWCAPCSITNCVACSSATVCTHCSVGLTPDVANNYNACVPTRL
jgi:hypothetical protein